MNCTLVPEPCYKGGGVYEMQPQIQAELSFDGPTYESKFDAARLGAQSRRVWDAMAGGKWRTLSELAAMTGDHSESAISARLRDFRKVRFGSHEVNRRARGDRESGLFEYQLVAAGNWQRVA